MLYSIDTSGLIETWVRDLPRDVFPSVWEKIEELIDNRVVVASEEVLFELEGKQDALYQWADKRRHMFVPTDVKIQEAVRFILREYPKLLDTRKNRSGADPFVIALALVENLSVVTDESMSNSLHRPKIPDVCKALDISWLKMVDLLREQGFHL